MKGLVKKDLLILQKNSKMLLILLVVYFICSLKSDGIESFLLPFMTAVFCISTFSYDEFNKWDAYAVTLPGSRSSIVKAKYTVGLLTVLVSFGLTIVLSLILGAIRNNIDLGATILYSLIGIATGLIIIALIFPLIIKFGLEKGRISIMIASFGFSALVMLVGSIVKAPKALVGFLEKYLAYMLPIIAVLLFIGSYLLAKRIYAKKEF